MTNGDIDKVFVDLKSRLRNFKKEFVAEFLPRVERRTPVLSGALQKGWGTTMKQEGFEVYNTKDYAGFVEYGTPLQRPQGMLRATIAESEQIAEIAMSRAKKKK